MIIHADNIRVIGLKSKMGASVVVMGDVTDYCPYDFLQTRKYKAAN